MRLALALALALALSCEPEPPPPLCEDLDGCEAVVCNTAGACVCTRPDSPPVECRRVVRPPR